MKSQKPYYVCTECEYRSIKWLGKCPSCGAWSSFEESIPEVEAPTSSLRPRTNTAKAVKLDTLELPTYMRSTTGMGELDRVLGGGLVNGSVVLLSGEPGIGKSTLLMQISNALGQNRRVLYVSGEESGGQLKLRAQRLGISADGLFLLTETNVEGILEQCNSIAPDVVIVDSIQTVWSDRVASAAGSLTQVREGAMAFINFAKTKGVAVILVGHVNKEGGISGPKVLEHMVDAVLYFEGERRQSYRLIRAIKNRYGSTNEIGVFEMTDIGLAEVANPSQTMLEGRPKDTSGNCAGCTMEGTRPLLTEIQALVSQTVFPSPRRTADGFDYNRMCLLLAVLEKRMNLRFSQNDVYLNIAGGVRLDEPAADLAVATALISGITDKVVPEGLIAIGEIGLSGEVRSVSHVEYRVKEAERLGFTQIVIPKRNVNKRIKTKEGVKLYGISTIFELLPLLVGKDKPKQN